MNVLRLGKLLETNSGREWKPFNKAKRDRGASVLGLATNDQPRRRLLRTRQAGGHWFEPSTAHLRNALHMVRFFVLGLGDRRSRCNSNRVVCAHLCPLRPLERPVELA